MTQPPYGHGPDPDRPPPAQGGYGAPPQGGYPPPSAQSGHGAAPTPGYGTPAAPGGYATAPPGGYAVPPGGYPAPPGGYPGGTGSYGTPQGSRSKAGVIIAAVVGVLAVGGIILAVVLTNRLPDPAAVMLGEDPVLNELAQSCFDGEMSACDDLFLPSPAGSDYERYGNTCGGRVEEANVNGRYCGDIV